jgi:hypothetical protein
MDEIKLYEADHSYYCSTTNYYSSDQPLKYKNWKEFITEEGHFDIDLNLIFRWDWKPIDEEGKYSSDINYRDGILELFYMGQRKGLFRCVEVEVCRADEPEVRKFLQVRFNHMIGLWAPFL